MARHYTKQELEALGAHAATMADPSVPKGAWETPAGQMGWVVLGSATQAFLRDAASHGWVRPDLDWPAWAKTSAAKALYQERALVAVADTEELAYLVTSLVRGDRFTEGTLLHAAESGLLGAICQRAAVLAAATIPQDG